MRAKSEVDGGVLRVRLSEAAHCLLETDNEGLMREWDCVLDGGDGDLVCLTERGVRVLRDTAQEYVDGWRDGIDNVGAAKRTGAGILRAVDKAVAKREKGGAR